MSLHDGSIDDRLNVVLSISRIDDPLPFGVLLDVVLREELETHVWCHRLKTKKEIQKLLLSSTVVMQTYSCNCTTKLASCVEKKEKRIRSPVPPCSLQRRCTYGTNLKILCHLILKLSCSQSLVSMSSTKQGDDNTLSAYQPFRAER